MHFIAINFCKTNYRYLVSFKNSQNLNLLLNQVCLMSLMEYENTSFDIHMYLSFPFTFESFLADEMALPQNEIGQP